jgi:hypothetical protein
VTTTQAALAAAAAAEMQAALAALVAVEQALKKQREIPIKPQAGLLTQVAEVAAEQVVQLEQLADRAFYSSAIQLQHRRLDGALCRD